MKKTFRILSLDGGGLRGIIPVLLLKEIEKRTGKRIVELFDLFAGTSTGGLIVCALTVSDDGKIPVYSLQEVEEIYSKRGNEIFPKKSFAGKIIKSVTSLKTPRFSAKGLDKVLNELLGSRRMTNCLKPILITSFDLYNNEALFFKSRHALAIPGRNALLKDVCRATSAAPTYLPAYKFTFDGKTRVCVDGGVYINNPSVASLVEVTKYHMKPPYDLEEISLNDIQVLSIGTGQYTANIARKKVEKWGLLDWATSITDVMMQAVNQTASYITDELTSLDNFLRINIDIANQKYADMADSSDKTREYLISELNSQVFENTTLMRQLDSFIEKLLQE